MWKGKREGEVDYWAIECHGPLSGRPIIVPCFGLAVWAEVAAQALRPIAPSQPASRSIVPGPG